MLREDCNDCEWSETWDGGSAADDPGIGHLVTNPSHTVSSEVIDDPPSVDIDLYCGGTRVERLRLEEIAGFRCRRRGNPLLIRRARPGSHVEEGEIFDAEVNCDDYRIEVVGVDV